MEKAYEIAFTDAFWRAVDELGLPRSEVMTKSLGLMDNPLLGRNISGQGGSIRVWDVTIDGKTKFRWFYIIHQELSLVVSVFIIPNEKPSRNRGEDAILMARLVEIAWRILTGG